jgi:hypothetical protein
VNTDVPAHLQPFDENLSLPELIKAINADRARQHAENQSGQGLTWDNLATTISRAASTMATS